MAVYWLIFSYFAAGSLLHRENARDSRYGYVFLAIGGLLIAVMIGFRYEVGGDWFPYLRMLSYVRLASFDQIRGLGDPAYQFLNWIAAAAGAGIWLVNLICGAIFAWGLLAFARVQSNPWLAVVIAVPYLVIVVAMGYSRQGVAIGILMAGLARLLRGGTTLKFLLYVGAAALFHRTAIVLVPLVILTGERSRMLNLVLTLALGFVFYDLFFSSAADRFIQNYIGAEYNSEGAAVSYRNVNRPGDPILAQSPAVRVLETSRQAVAEFFPWLRSFFWLCCSCFRRPPLSIGLHFT